MTADQRRTFRAVIAADTAVLVVFAAAMTAHAGPDAPVWDVLTAVADAWTQTISVVQAVWQHVASAVLPTA